MAPPDRDDQPREQESRDVLADRKIDKGAHSRMAPNAATPMTAPLVATLRATPGEGSPQRPLLHGPDDSDSPYPGACADLGDAADCVPYARTTVPSGDELLDTTDPDVFCAVAMDAVATVFGEDMEPVTTGEGGCHFVSPERLVQLTFDVRPDRLSSATGHGPERVTIAGHPGFVEAGPVADGRLPAEVVAEVEPVLAEIVWQHFSG